MDKESLKLSHSQIQTFLTCRKKWEWTYKEELVPKGTSKALQTGSIIHDLLELYYKKELTMEKIKNLEAHIKEMYPENSTELTEEVLYEVVRLFNGYISAWKNDTLNVVATETWLEHYFEEENFILAGRADGLARSQTNNLWRVEHKTAAKTDSAYLNGLKGSLQGAIYDFLIEQSFRENIEGTIYNLLIKTKEAKFSRSWTLKNPKAQERMLQTIHGIVRDIRRGDYYPSSACFFYNNVCEYKTLCDHDSPETREAFFKKRVSPIA